MRCLVEFKSFLMTARDPLEPQQACSQPYISHSYPPLPTGE